MKEQLSDKSRIQSKHLNDSESCFSIYISNITTKINSTGDFQAFDKKRMAEYNTFLGNSGVKRQNLRGQGEQSKGLNRHICEAL